MFNIEQLGFLSFTLCSKIIDYDSTNPETASREGGVGVRRSIWPQHIRHNTNIYCIAIVWRHEAWRSSILGNRLTRVVAWKNYIK
jgi:hypothetical protein